MKKIFLFLSLLVILIIPLFGCMEDAEPPPPPTPATSSQDATQNTDITALKAKDAELKTAIDTTNTKLDQNATNIAVLQSQSSTNMYTKDEIDDLLEELQDDIDAIDDNGSSGSSSNDDYGDLVDSDGDLELWLESINPSSDPFRMSTGVDEVLFDVVIVNLDDRSHKYDLSIRLTPEDACTIANTATIDVHPGDFDMTATRADWPTPTNNENSIYIDNGDDVWIGGDEVEHYSIAVEFDTTVGSTYWDFKLFIEDKS